MTKVVQCEVIDGVATITIDNPKKRNCLMSTEPICWGKHAPTLLNRAGFAGGCLV